MKDAVLDRLAEAANVAQFVSFDADPALPLRHCRIAGVPPEHGLASPDAAIDLVLSQSAAGTVNVRAFHADQPKGHPFHYGLSTRDEAVEVARKLAADGLYTIVNETIPIDDGGVSGVSMGGVVEFAPDDTPRCVEKPGTAALPHAAAVQLLETVYGFRPGLDHSPHERMEFSIHPRRVGYRRGHTITWELEAVGSHQLRPAITWPNRFSRMLGDKVFGLLVADLLGGPVPRTTVVNRRVAPFAFGEPTGTSEWWLRTAPSEPAPGRYTTLPHWVDPFELLQEEDPERQVAAVLAQEGVQSAYAGALLPDSDGGVLIEGVAGTGDSFMLGKVKPQQLPEAVVADVTACARRLAAELGPVRVEWVHDGGRVWVVQLQPASGMSTAAVIHPGEAVRWHDFDPAEGLEALRALIDRVAGSKEGVIVTGGVGVTSHVGDLLRRAQVPSRLAAASQERS